MNFPPISASYFHVLGFGALETGPILCNTQGSHIPFNGVGSGSAFLPSVIVTDKSNVYVTRPQAHEGRIVGT